MASFFCHVLGVAKRVRLERTVRPRTVVVGPSIDVAVNAMAVLNRMARSA